MLGLANYGKATRDMENWETAIQLMGSSRPSRFPEIEFTATS